MNSNRQLLFLCDRPETKCNLQDELRFTDDAMHLTTFRANDLQPWLLTLQTKNDAILVIDNVSRMSTESQNVLLQTLVAIGPRFTCILSGDIHVES